MFNLRTFKLVVGKFHTSSVEFANKAQLSKLRKKTGFPFIKCRNALDKFDNDIDLASKWLKEQAQKEGWAKATKLADRPMSNGIISVFKESNSASLLEVNCETDFVSRNVKFQNLVISLTKIIGNCEISTNKKQWTHSEFDKEINDLVALEIGNIGENIKFRRAARLSTSRDQFLYHYVHPSGAGPIEIDNCNLGKFGSVIVLNKLRDSEQEMDLIGRQLCQHIVGMKPASINAEKKEDEPKEPNETRLLHQEFLMDENLKVTEFLEQNSVEVVDFIRYELGEINDES